MSPLVWGGAGSDGLIAAAGFCAAAAVILVRRFYGLLESVDMVVPLSLWVMRPSSRM